MWRVVFLAGNKDYIDFQTLDEAYDFCKTLDFANVGTVIVKHIYVKAVEE